MNKPTKHIFVCTSSRMTGVAKGFCHTKGALEIIQKFSEKLEEEDISDVMLINTGCFILQSLLLLISHFLQYHKFL